MKTMKNLLAAGMAATLLTGCAGAAFNSLDMTVQRNITVGQELMDLQEAHEKGISSDSEGRCPYTLGAAFSTHVSALAGDLEVQGTCDEHKRSSA